MESTQTEQEKVGQSGKWTVNKQTNSRLFEFSIPSDSDVTPPIQGIVKSFGKKIWVVITDGNVFGSIVCANKELKSEADIQEEMANLDFDEGEMEQIEKVKYSSMSLLGDKKRNEGVCTFAQGMLKELSLIGSFKDAQSLILTLHLAELKDKSLKEQMSILRKLEKQLLSLIK